MRKLFLSMLLVLALAASALAKRPLVEARLVVDSRATSFPTQEGNRLLLGPPLAPFEITGATARQSEVQLVLAPATAAAFEQATANNVGHQLAIVVDGVVQSTPLVREKIRGGK